MIDLTVPASVAAPFVVATAHPLDDPVRAARGRVSLPLAAELLGSSLLRVRGRPVAESGYADLIRTAARARPDEAHLLDGARHHIVITSHAPPVSQPAHAQAVRDIARAVAEACDGVVYDAWSHQVLPRAFRLGPEHPEFCLADDWLATFVTGEEGGEEGRGEKDELHLVTAGLHRFGFPELEAAAVPGGNLFAAVTLLRCLAVGLLDEHWAWLACNPGAPLRRVPAEARVDGADVWRYWAAEPTGAAGAPVRVRLSPAPPERADGLPYLVVGPPAGFDAPAALWWNDVVDLAMPYVPEAPRRTAA
ncbi:hypothetical protein [Actinoallomurus soli]|uniref:hypothetical protein n=1 Tax=Actinoallomurus soli TaxID=2952535 RepID=UPI0020933D20|nr:hypothetical protein [Actinoallomurus soli]MCO5972061.1 hypothetical protein [Actinoallomurus soli]